MRASGLVRRVSWRPPGLARMRDWQGSRHQ